MLDPRVRARAARAHPSEKCAVASDDGGPPWRDCVTDAPARGKERRHERRGATRASDGANARRARRSRTKSARIAKSAPKSRTSVIVSLAFGFYFSPKKCPGRFLAPTRVPACEALCCGAPRALTCGAEQATRRSARMAVQQIPVQRRPAWRVGAAGPIFAALPPHTEKMAARSCYSTAPPAHRRQRA